MSDFCRLTDRSPRPDRRQLLSAMVPPPRFAEVALDTYQPSPREPSQSAAVAALRSFAARVAAPMVQRRSWWRRAPAPPEQRSGVYLDGGFGVGKTHLLASLWHVVPEPKTFCTFVELTHLVGALGYENTIEALADNRLLCIDEFELDDPGDTVLMSSLLSRLTDRGVSLAATSNTLPDRLGEGRFAADDFLREIQGLAAHFDVYRIDGDDYRHRGAAYAPKPSSTSDLELAAKELGSKASLDDFGALLAHLTAVHPSAYGSLVQGIDLACMRGVRPIDDQAVALRFVVLVDRLYDRSVSVMASGSPVDEVFTVELLEGGYRKKYFRAISRLVSLVNSEPVART